MALDPDIGISDDAGELGGGVAVKGAGVVVRFDSGVVEKPPGAEEAGPVLKPGELLGSEDNVALENGNGTEE